MKRKILACVLACATLFLGMGYAYWTSSLQIDTKATTGELDVSFVDLAVYGQYAGQDHETGWAIVDGVGSTGFTPDWFFDRDNDNGTQHYNVVATQEDLNAYYQRVWGYTQTTFGAMLVGAQPLDVTVGPYGPNTNASDTIDIQLNKIYPGFAEIFQADIVNTGTIAAKLADLNVKINNISDDSMDDVLGVSMKVLREYAGNPSEGHVNVFNTASLATDQYFTLGGVDFIRLSALRDLMAGDQTFINDLIYVLPDDNRMDIYVGIAMDPDKAGVYTSGWTGDTNAANDDFDSKTENQSASFSIQFLWDQFNIDKPSTNPDHGQMDDNGTQPAV